jgi:hypothetical protein
VELGARTNSVGKLDPTFTTYVEIETITCSIEEPNAVQGYCGSNQILGEEVELGGRVWYPVKACHMRDNLSVETICCLAPFSSYTRCTSLTRGSSPILGETVEVGDRVWSFMKAYHIRPKTLSVETVTLSRNVYEQERIGRNTSPAVDAFGDGCRCQPQQGYSNASLMHRWGRTIGVINQF